MVLFTPTKILPNLYLGSSFNAYDIDQLNKLNINVIINVTKEIKNFHESNLTLCYYKYSIRDNNIDDITDILVDTCKTISFHSNDNILVHCYMGASRSACVIINYLMCTQRLRYILALEYVKEKRPIVNLSEKFANTLAQTLVQTI